MNASSIILNSNILSLKESATLAINERVKKRRAEGQTVYHFGFGQSPFEVHPKIQQALKDNSQRKEYLPTQGLPELREAFCSFYERFYGYKFTKDLVLVGPGSKELIFQALFVLEGPLLIPAPSWVSYGPQAHIRGKHVHVIQTRKENGYKLTADELKSTCRELVLSQQKVLILNNPNNPTGAVYSDDEIRAISEVCRAENVVVVSDEIYALIDFSGQPFRGFSQHLPEKTIITSGLSKGFSAGGYRLGFLAVPESMRLVMKCLSAMVSETYSAVSAPTQFAALAAFSGDTDIMESVNQNKLVHKATGTYLYERFTKMGLGCVQPQGAFYLFPDFEEFAPKLKRIGINSSQELCEYLFDKVQVAMLPGSDFYCQRDYFGVRVATVDYNGKDVYEASLRYGKELDNAFVEASCPNLKNGCDALEGFLSNL